MKRISFAALVVLGLSIAAATGFTLAKLLPELPGGTENDAHEAAENEPHTDEKETHPEEEGHDHEQTSDSGPGSENAEERGGEVVLTPSQIALAGIAVAPVTVSTVDVTLDATGEGMVNQDRLVEVVPFVPGIAREVRVLLGMQVKKGDVVAVIDSRELADAKSAWVVARERTKLSQTKFERDDRLRKKKIVPEQEYLDTRAAMTEARIEQRAAEQKLRALGLTEDDLRALAAQPDQSLTRYEVVAPMDGTVIAKHVTTGESVDISTPIYQIADLSTVWIIASIYEKDFARVKPGQRTAVSTRAFPGRTFEGRLTWISDTIDERTRTLKVRIEVENPERLLRPGMFFTTMISVDRRDGVLTVPAAAVRRLKGETVVFIDEGQGQFERRDVETGAKSEALVEIVRGVKQGERVVSAGSFILKSELEKGGFEAGHGH